MTFYILHPTSHILLGGWLLDLLFGDPSWLPHPVVAFGRWISFWEHRLNHGHHRTLKGAILALTSIVLVFALTWLLLNKILPLIDFAPFPNMEGVGGAILSILLIFFCLAGRTLRHEVRDVFRALDRSLEDGRRQVARIVGRDTANLSAQEVRTAALETLAENLSDGVIAPLFWFAILGVPGMLTYKMVNTLDSMIGYRNERYRDFGCWAAHIDDIANYIPARITALLILIANAIIASASTICTRATTVSVPVGFPDGKIPFNLSILKSHFRFVLRYGPSHASPNSGWPEAALAAVLDCRFGGPHDYFGQLVEKPYIGTNPRTLTTPDMQLSLRIAFLTETIAVIATALLSIVLNPFT